jgi:hypothetical protein
LLDRTEPDLIIVIKKQCCGSGMNFYAPDPERFHSGSKSKSESRQKLSDPTGSRSTPLQKRLCISGNFNLALFRVKDQILKKISRVHNTANKWELTELAIMIIK